MDLQNQILKIPILIPRWFQNSREERPPQKWYFIVIKYYFWCSPGDQAIIVLVWLVQNFTNYQNLAMFFFNLFFLVRLHIEFIQFASDIKQ